VYIYIYIYTYTSTYTHTHTYTHKNEDVCVICLLKFNKPKKKPRTPLIYCGPGSSVGIATDYGLDGPGSNPGGDEIFRPSRSALGSNQPSVKRVPGLSRG